MRVIKRVIVPASKQMIIKVIEFISGVLTDDAKQKYGRAYGFKTHVRHLGGSTVETYVQFFPYKYDFIWKINPNKLGYEVVLDARTSNKWAAALFGMDRKLAELSDTQWSAFVNFFHGYLTALAFNASGKSPKAHISKARKKLKER